MKQNISSVTPLNLTPEPPAAGAFVCGDDEGFAAASLCWRSVFGGCGSALRWPCFMPLRVMVLFLMMLGSVKGAEGVVLIHGLSRKSASMAKMERALASAGYVVLNCDYPSRTQPIERLSVAVVGGALADKRLHECTKVHFVTHSMGGILVRYYFANRKDERLGRVVMLGPPNKGSEVVDHLRGWWVFRKANGPAGEQLGTDKDSVPNRLGPVCFELGVIAGDRSINWVNSCMIRGRDDGKVSVESTKVEGMQDHLVVHTTHPFMIKNRRVIASVIAFLKSGQFPRKGAAVASPNGGPAVRLTGKMQFAPWRITRGALLEFFRAVSGRGFGGGRGLVGGRREVGLQVTFGGDAVEPESAGLNAEGPQGGGEGASGEEQAVGGAIPRMVGERVEAGDEVASEHAVGGSLGEDGAEGG